MTDWTPPGESIEFSEAHLVKVAARVNVTVGHFVARKVLDPARFHELVELEVQSLIGRTDEERQANLITGPESWGGL